ncbi:MAG: hypothetical protein AAGJ46_08755 [Planctomycetota bacterium]
MSSDVEIEHEQRSSSGRKGWLAFNLIYLAIFFTGWIWQTPGRDDIIAAAIDDAETQSKAEPLAVVTP